MKLSTKARYAVTAMMELGMNDGKKPVTLADISQYQGISLSYLEQLFARLRKQGLVSGVRGPGGGYRLARPANEISIAEIVATVNGKEVKNAHDKMEAAPDEGHVLDAMWDNLSQKIFNFLSQISLADCLAPPPESGQGGESSDEPGKPGDSEVAA